VSKIRRTGVLIALAVFLGTAGCETLKGLGKDLETLGKELQKSATRKESSK